VRPLLPLSLLALLGCSETRLSSQSDLTDVTDTDADGGGTDGGGDDDAEEDCNGIDDDGDGLVDEGHPDVDGDGVADCVDRDCTLESAAPGTVEPNPDCLAPDVDITDPWNVAIEWQYTVKAGNGVIVMPAVGNLTDDDGDGDIDQHDDPDIVFTTWGSHHTLVALHGDGSGEIFEVSGYDGNAGVAIADIDRDGEPEIITATPDDRIVALSADGTEEWRTGRYPFQMYPQPTVADLEGDGDVEVIFDVAIVEGRDGSPVTTLEGMVSSWRAPAVADVNADGVQEILLGEHAYRPDGSILFSTRFRGTTGFGDSTFAAVADIDGDIGGESFWVTGQQMHIHDDDGTLLRSVALNPGSSRPGPPSVADFDGDGKVEVAVPASRQIEMFETDGRRLWSRPVQDTSGIAGVSGYDVDADGIYEVLYADEVSLRVFDGASGDVLYTDSNHSSATLWEYPVVADVDNDGSAEIVIASNGAVWRGITVLGHAGDGWAKSGSTWSLHDFAMTNIHPDGSVPSPAPRSWDLYNVFRARPTVDDAAADLSPRVVDACIAGCADESPVRIAVQVENRGGLPMEPGVWVALYSLDGATETLIDALQVPEAIESGETSATLEFSFPAAHLGPDGVRLRVDDDGSGVGMRFECDEDNNTLDLSDWPC